MAKNWELIAKHFDPMEYWHTVGRQQFPHIYIVACLYLAMPNSNGHQERTFSTATWFDGKLNNRQHDVTLEMKIVVARNKFFLQQVDEDLQESHRKAAEATTKALLELHYKFMKDAAGDSDDSVVDITDSDSSEDDALYSYLVSREGAGGGNSDD